MKKKIIAFAWWWSGWHIFPIKNLIEKINTKYYTILWFGEKNSLEEKVANQLKKEWKYIIFLNIFSWKIRRQINIKFIILNIIDFFKNIIWFFQSLYYIYKYKPKFDL